MDGSFSCAHTFVSGKPKTFPCTIEKNNCSMTKVSQCNCYLLLWSVVILKINPEVKFKSQRGNVLTLLTLTESVIPMSFASR